MSGHSKWHGIKHKKGIIDAARGKIFTKCANMITIAAKEGGGDPNMNPTLRLALEKAKEVNMPSQNVERAIKKGTGEGKEGFEIFEVMYEGYGPGGVALLVKTVPDNKNRAVASLRSIFTKNGGHLGEEGGDRGGNFGYGIRLGDSLPDFRDSAGKSGEQGVRRRRI